MRTGGGFALSVGRNLLSVSAQVQPGLLFRLEMGIEVGRVRETSFGEHLAELRRRSGKSLEVVAQLIGVPQKVLEEYEGDEVIPKRKATYALSRAIGCDSYWLLKWRERALLRRQGLLR